MAQCCINYDQVTYKTLAHGDVATTAVSLCSTVLLHLLMYHIQSIKPKPVSRAPLFRNGLQWTERQVISTEHSGSNGSLL